MAEFRSDLIVKVYNGGGEYELVQPLVYHSELAGTIVVPAGFHTDFASIPKFLPITKAFLGERGRKAAVIHDYLYRNGIGTREQADAIFKEALYATENWFVARVMWAGVRL